MTAAPAKAIGKTPHQPAWRVILTMIRYQPLLWTAHLADQIMFMLLIQVQALVIREFFNLLSGSASAWSVWGLILLLYAARLARNAGQLASVETETPLSAR